MRPAPLPTTPVDQRNLQTHVRQLTAHGPRFQNAPTTGDFIAAIAVENAKDYVTALSSATATHSVPILPVLLPVGPTTARTPCRAAIIVTTGPGASRP